MTPRPILSLLLLPGAMGAWALTGLFREVTSATPESWRLACFGIAFLIFVGLGVAAARRRPTTSGGA